MDSLVAVFAFSQGIGALIGALSAVWSEYAYIRAMHDGRIDHAEREHLRVIGRGLTFGMSLLLIASIGLVVLAYARAAVPQPAFTSSYWTLIVLVFIILGSSWAL